MRKLLTKVALIALVLCIAPALFSVDTKVSKTPVKSGVAQVNAILAEKDLVTTKAEQSAIKKWDARARREITAAKTAKEVSTCLNFTRHASAEWNLGIEKWDALSRDEVARATTIEEADLAWKHARPQSKPEKDGEIKVDLLCLDAAKKITKFKDLFKAVARPGTPAEKLLTEKQRTLAPQAIRDAESIQELWAIAKKCEHSDELGKLFASCWDKLALKVVRDARTLEDLRTAFYEARDGSEAQKIAVREAAKFLPD